MRFSENLSPELLWNDQQPSWFTQFVNTSAIEQIPSDLIGSRWIFISLPKQWGKAGIFCLCLLEFISIK